MAIIQNNHPIFENPAFLEKQSTFYFIMKNRYLNQTVHASDGKHYLISKSGSYFPSWVYVDGKLDTLSLDELIRDLKTLKVQQLVCQQALYAQLKLRMQCSEPFKMGSYCLKDIQMNQWAQGHLALASLDEATWLTQWWCQATHEMNGVRAVSLNEASQQVDNMIASHSVYLWLNEQNEPCCMATIDESGDFVKFGHVYTPEIYRGKGYAATLIANLSKDALERRKIPVLYTDFHYQASNRAYTKVGFQLTEVLYTLMLQEE